MKEFLHFFSLTTEGDTPIGLKDLSHQPKLNQPTYDERREVLFTPLFKQDCKFSVIDANGKQLTEHDCGLLWLNFLSEKQ